MATRSPPDRGRRGAPPLALLGIAVLIALVIAYLSDCIPGLGSGVEPSTTPPSAPAGGEAPARGQAARIVITVEGDRCRQGQAPAAPCPEVCAGLDRTHAATLEVQIEATEGRHGVVEELRGCLQEAGFAKVRVHAE